MITINKPSLKTNNTNLAFRFYGNPSTHFRARIVAEMKSEPTFVTNMLASNEYTITGCHRLTETYPYLKNAVPRGNKKRTWDNVNCKHSSGDIAVAEEYTDLETGQRMVEEHVEESLRHEVGHGVGYVAQIYFPTDGNYQRFETVYRKDLEQLTERQREKLAYFLLHGYHGIRETSAEMIAIQLGGGRLQRRDCLDGEGLEDLFLSGFQRVRDFIEKDIFITLAREFS